MGLAGHNERDGIERDGEKRGEGQQEDSVGERYASVCEDTEQPPEEQRQQDAMGDGPQQSQRDARSEQEAEKNGVRRQNAVLDSEVAQRHDIPYLRDAAQSAKDGPEGVIEQEGDGEQGQGGDAAG